MPATVHTSIRRLKLDLTNFRTVRQPDEIRAVQAMISISPDYFWALFANRQHYRAKYGGKGRGDSSKGRKPSSRCA